MAQLAIDNSIKQQFYKFGEYETCLYRSGKGNKEKILFLHGSGPGVYSLVNWRYSLKECGENFDCLAPDLIGFGNSSHPDPGPESRYEWIRIWMQQIIHLLDELKIEKINIVGNSLGCQVALELLIEHPERFNRIVLMGAGGTPNTKISTELLRAKHFYDNPSPESIKQIMSWFVYDAKSLEKEIEEIAIPRFEMAMRPEVKRSNSAIFAGQALAIPETALRRLQHEVLLVHGLEDKVCSIESSYYFLEHIPKAQLHVYSQTGHWAQIERKESFNQLISQYFSRKI